MGFKTVLPDTFVGAGASNPKIYPDQLMSEGSLFLLDGGHSMGGLSATPGVQLNNVACETAAAMIGSGTEATLSTTLITSGIGTGCGKELTPRGGLHIAARQDGTVTSYQGYRIELPTLIKNYMLANINNDYYVSLWMRTTRAAVEPMSAVGYPLLAITDTTGATGNYLALLSSIAPSGTNLLGHRESAGLNGTGNQIRNMARSAPLGTVDDIRAEFLSWGATGSWASSLVSNPDDLPSWCLYRAYVEDLTVSGRTYAQVDALDLAAYTTAFASGGRFYGDTLTAPATLAGA